MRDDLVGRVLEHLLRGLEGAEARGGEERGHARHGRERLGPGLDECPLHPCGCLLVCERDRVSVRVWESACVRQSERECVRVCESQREREREKDIYIYRERERLE